MKRVLSFILCLILCLSYLPSEGYANSEEVIYANDIEDGFEGLKYYTGTSFENSMISTACSTLGEKSVYIVDSGKDVTNGVTTDMIKITEGEVYTASVDSYIVEGSVRVFFKYYDSKGKQLETKSGGSVPGKWENVVIPLVAPKRAVYCAVVLCSVNSSFGKAYFDNIKVYRGEVAAKKISGTIPEIIEEVTPEVEKITELTNYSNKDARLVFSESFENGIDGWGYHNSNLKDAVIVTDDKAYDGKQSVFITDPSGETAPGIKSPFIDIKSGEAYTVVGYMYGINNNSIKLFVKYYNESKKNVHSSSYGAKVNGRWTALHIQTVAPADASFCQIFIAGISSSIGDAYIDNVSLYEGHYTPEAIDDIYVAPVQAKAVDSKIIAPMNNKLVYNEYNEYGDKLSDFSYAGFYGGDYGLPVTENLSIKETLSPSGKNDAKRIQEAIDKWERKDGGINVIKLNAGTFNVGAEGIKIKSGVLLSGEGQGPTGTILYAYNPMQYIPVKFAGEEPQETGNKAIIQDEYLKAGSKIITLKEEDIKDFSVGDKIAIVHNSTEEWAKALKMVGVINVYDDDTTWTPGSVNMSTERIITKIEGNKITLDFSVFVPHMKSLVPSYVTKISDDGRVRNAGIENLRIVSYYNGNKNDEDHATSAISITNSENIFARDITAKHFYSSLISSGKKAKKVTAVNCSSLEPVSLVTGSRRYSFASSTSAQQILYTGCYSFDGRHDFETSFSVTGPIAYVDNVVDSSNTASETHGTWSTGVLFDNIYHIGNETKGYMAMALRGRTGTKLSQGWTTAGSVMWNCLASTVLINKPPLSYQNFFVGMWGQYKDADATAMKEKNINSNKGGYRTGESTEYKEENFATDENTSFVGDAYNESKYNPVNPRSLYKAQLSERYTGVISNAKPNAPVIVYPKPDKYTDESKVNISGLYQLGAEEVTVYVDNIPYKAQLKDATCEFEVALELSEGTHKIYATQRIDGREGNKTADRFIIIKEEGENYEYLKSVYTPEQTSMLINDPRPSYDEIINGIKVEINGNLLYSDVLPCEIQGRVLVPMRAIFESFGAEVSWDASTSTATATLNGTEVKITENSTLAYVNNSPVTLDVSATILNGRFIVPVRFVSETFGAKVGWIDETKTVLIKK